MHTTRLVRIAGTVATAVLPWDRIGVIPGWPPAGTPGENGADSADLARILTATGATVLPAHSTSLRGPKVGWAIPEPDLALLTCVGRAFGQTAVLLVDQEHIAVLPVRGGTPRTAPRSQAISRSGGTSDTQSTRHGQARQGRPTRDG